MKRLIRIFAIMLGFILLALGIGYFVISPEVEVEESMIINASAEAIFPHVNNLQAWEKWSPWREDDATMRATYSGSEAGVGAMVAWESEHSGSGTQKIVSSDPPKTLQTVLDFGGMGTATADWRFQQVDGGTKVT